MKPRDHITDSNLDGALIDIFNDAPSCGAFGTIDDLSRRRMMNQILEIDDMPIPDGDERGPRPRYVYAALAGIAALIVMSLVGTWLLRTTSFFSNGESSHHGGYYGEVQRTGGALYFNGRMADVHAPIPVGRSIRTDTSDAMLRLPTGIAWQLEPHSRGNIAPLQPDRLEVNVLKGESWFRVDPTRSGPSFSVNTKMGRIEVTGTIFVVNAEPSEVRITLLKGEVWVIRPSGHRDRVSSGHVLSLGQNTQRRLSPDTRQQMLDKLAALTWSAARKEENAVSMIPEADRESELDIPSPLEKSHRAVGPKYLISKIQFHRKHRNWGKVAQLYKQLIQSAPSSETAVVSRVSLGEIYLSKLQQYKNALSQFERYLHSGHTALLPEATYGKCRTLKALGKREGEIRCLDGFVRQFSSAFQAQKARARLERLKHRDRI